jgi:hypothetical protein
MLILRYKIWGIRTGWFSKAGDMGGRLPKRHSSFELQIG